MQEKGVCKERHVTVCKQMRLCREIVKKVRLFKQHEVEDKTTLRKHVLSYLLLRQKSLALAAFVDFFFFWHTLEVALELAFKKAAGIVPCCSEKAFFHHPGCSPWR